MELVEIRTDGQKIQRNRAMRCLGVLVDNGLTWKVHVHGVRKQCFAGLAKLRRLKDVLPPDTKKIYNAIVLPHLKYCSVVWQNCTKDLRMKLERVQIYGMRIIPSQPATQNTK